MAKRVFNYAGTNVTASALGSAAGSGFYMAVKANTTAATQLVDILEIKISGTGTASAVLGTTLARVSTNETGAQTALASPNSDGPQSPFTAALTNPPNTFIAAATTQPTPSSAAADTKVDLSTNAFGGIVRENFAPTQQFSIFGAATPFQECALFNSSSAGGATGSFNALIMYEPY